MPGVPAPGESQWALQDAQVRNLLRGLLAQQQATISNTQGQPVLNLGLVPGSNPAAVGLQFVNPSTGGQLMFVGEDGNAYMGFYDGNGVMRIKIDAVGFHVYNASGTEEARLGELATSPALYGLAVLNAGGTLQQVAGIDGASGGSGTATSSTQVDLGASVTSIIGPSGQAVVTICGSVEMNPAAASGGYAYMGVSIDGAAASTNWVNCQDSLTGSTDSVQLTLSLSASRLLTGLSAGSHTFAAKGWVSAGVSSGVYGNVAVTVQPL